MMKTLFWKFRYAKHLKKLLGLTMKESLISAVSALENIDYDLTECPIDCADEEASCWVE